MTSLQSSPNRLRNKILTLMLFLLFEGGAFSQTPQKVEGLPPGVIGSLKQVATQTKDLLTTEYRNLRASNQIEATPNVELVKRAQFDSLFLKSLFLHSQQRYLDMISYNPCNFYALLENKLFRTSLGEPDYLLMRDGQRKFLIETKAFLKEAYKTKCQTLGQISQIFTLGTLKKTVSNLQFNVPKTLDQCRAIFNDWKTNDYLPYLCAIPDQIQKGKRSEKIKALKKDRSLALTRSLNKNISVAKQLEEDLPFFQRNYLANLCAGVENIENFCSPYLTSNAWSRIINGEIENFYLDHKCRVLLKKDTTKELTRTNRMACAKRLQDDPMLCTTRSTQGYSSLFPRPNCSLIGKAINETRLYTDYYDCPGQIDNGSVTNIHRIITHFFPKEYVSKPSTCKAEVNYTLKVLRDKSKNVKTWPLKICYDDKIEGKEICLDYIPGSLSSIPSSEDRIVTQILRRTNQIRSNQSCQVISSLQYNPALLEFKNGCFVVFDEKNCSDAFCPRQIIVNEEKVKGLKYTGKTSFDYFPNNWMDQNKSAVKLLEEVYKLKPRQLRNLTNLEVYLRQKPNGIIHGVGCAEDILPQFFKRKSFNFCTPIPFILDGIVTVNENKVLVTRTAYDDIHSPRLIPWNWIFTGVMKYQNHHPLNQWNLYGLSL